jgi:hypothetical protein
LSFFTAQPRGAILEDFEEERQNLKVEYERAIEELRNSYETEQKSKEKLQGDLDK